MNAKKTSPTSSKPCRVSVPAPTLPLPRTPIPILALIIILLFLSACDALSPTPSAPPITATPRDTSTPVVFPPTWTPAPPTEAPPTDTPAIKPTWTPIPSVTPRIPLPPSATAFPPVEMVFGDEPLPIAYDLLFIEGGRLKQLERETTTIVEPIQLEDDAELRDVQAFTLSDDGQKLLVARILRGTYQLILFNRPTEEILWTKSVESAGVVDAAISPDGEWAAYIAYDSAAMQSAGRGEVYILDIETPDEPVMVGACDPSCTGFLWRPDSAALAWGDRTGVWQVDPAAEGAQEPTQLSEPFRSVLTGGGHDIYGSYAPVSWSPVGRYLILSEGVGDERAWVVLDVQSARVEVLPGPFLYIDSRLSIGWLEDETLVVTRAVLGFDEGEVSVVEFWRIDPTNADTLLTRTTIITAGETPADAPFAPFQIGGGQLFYALLNYGSTEHISTNGIYFAELGESAKRKVSELPFMWPQDVVWSPDASSALFVSGQGLYLVPLDGGQIFNLRSIIRSTACCFTWVR